MTDKTTTSDQYDAYVTRGGACREDVSPHGHYYVECHNGKGELVWADHIENLVTTVGKNLLMDTIFGNTAAGAVVLGLKGTGTAVVGDTQASHGSWLEVGGANAPVYTGNRQAMTFGAASGGTKSTSVTNSFSITSTGTVAGCFINIAGSATKDDTTGKLYSVGDFGSAKAVNNLDVVTVTYTGSAV